MTHIPNTILLAICLLSIQILAGASEYGFCTKVLAQDNDTGRELNDLPNVDIRYWDIGPNPGFYDEGDVLYLGFVPGFPVVNSNAVRITPFENYPAGSKVKAGDKDIDMPLVPFAFPQIVFLDLFGISSPVTLDLQDPVYFQDAAAVIQTNNVRLTNVSGKAPGTKVINFDPDHSKPVASPPLQALPVAANLPPSRIDYFDANGNGLYDYPDDVYWSHFAAGPGPNRHVHVNSLRLSGPAY